MPHGLGCATLSVGHMTRGLRCATLPMTMAHGLCHAKWSPLILGP